METNNANNKDALEILKSKKLMGKNVIADIINVIAILEFIGGFILGLIMLITFCSDDYFYSLLWVPFIIWISAAVTGFMLMGFAQIINLLTDIRNNQLKK